MGAPQAEGAPAGSRPLTVDKTDSGSDWEYEYDESRTEDLYFTLDLPIEPPSKRRKTNAPKARATETLNSIPGPARSQYITNDNTPQQSKDEGQSELLRFSNLHMTNPSLEYCDQQFDSRWTTDLGTQFHVSRPGLIKSPYRAGHAVDVVALSRVRLTGSHSSNPPSPRTSTGNGSTAGQAIVLEGDEDDDDGSDDGATRKANASGGEPSLSFLERVAEVRRKKKRGPASNGAQSVET